MKKSDITKGIKKSGQTPVDKNWLNQGKVALASYISDNPVDNSVRKVELNSPILERGLFKKLSLNPMSIAIIALIATLLTGGGVASAAQNSLPTDILYPVKLTTESIQESFTFNKEKKIELHTRLAERRLLEIEKLQDKGEVAEEVLQKSLDRFAKRLASAQAHLSSINDNTNSNRKIATAIRLEDQIAKHQQILENIESRAGPRHRVALAHAKIIALEHSSIALENIGRPFTGLIATAYQAEDTAVAVLATDAASPEIPPTLRKMVDEEFIPHLKDRASQTIQKGKHKLDEIRRKIDIFSDHNNANCSQDQKDNQIKELKIHFTKMSSTLESAQELFNDQRYVASLNQANYLFRLAIQIDNFIGHWNSNCGSGTSRGQTIDLNQKFILGLNGTVSLKGHNINIHLSQLPHNCPKCEDGKLCALVPCLVANNALFIITFPPKELGQVINLSINHHQQISGNIYLKLLDISSNQVTAILIQDEISIPENIKVNLNQKFELFTGWTAEIIDFKNLKITLERIELIVCKTTPCPEAAYFLIQEQSSCITGTEPTEIPTSVNQLKLTEDDYGIRKETASGQGSPTTASSCAVSVKQIRLSEGENKVFSGARINLLSVNQDSVTLIVEPVVFIDCPLYFPPAPDWCEDGEIIPGKFNVNGCQGPPICLKSEVACTIPICNTEIIDTGAVDSNGCVIYKCQEEIITSLVPAVTSDDHIRGNPNAGITLLEYCSFEGPFCGRHQPTLDQLLTQYGDEVRLVYRHFPIASIYPNAQKSAEAAECAGLQGKFWEYHDLLFINQTSLSLTSLKSYAGKLGLDQSQFDSCLNDNKFTQLVKNQFAEAQAAGITGIPGTIVNDQLIIGALQIFNYQKIIDGLLN